MNRGFAVTAAALSLVVAGPALAVDGVIEINQAKALAGGVTPGDVLGGFPVMLSLPGSYRLTSDLALTAQQLNVHAISVEASNVTIDLNGFSIRGAASCSGTPVTSCLNTGGGDGITNEGIAGRDNIHVRNGTITGMPGRGIFLNGADSVVEDVRALGNGATGILVIGSGGSVVRRCEANRNGSTGVRAGFVLESEASGNLSDGISAGSPGDLVLQSKATANGGFGLIVGGAVVGYGQSAFSCNNSGGLCGNGAQVSGANALNLGGNLCGSDAVCP